MACFNLRVTSTSQLRNMLDDKVKRKCLQVSGAKQTNSAVSHAQLQSGYSCSLIKTKIRKTDLSTESCRTLPYYSRSQADLFASYIKNVSRQPPSPAVDLKIQRLLKKFTSLQYSTFDLLSVLYCRCKLRYTLNEKSVHRSTSNPPLIPPWLCTVWL